MTADSLPDSSAETTAVVQPMSRTGLTRRLLGGTFNYGLGSVAPKIVSFLLLPVFTRYLSPTDYGLLDLAGSLSGVLMIAMRFGVPGAVVRFYYDYEEGPGLRDYVTSVSWITMLTSLAVGVITLAISPWVIEPLLPGLKTVPFVWLVVIAALMTGNWDMQRRLIQAREQSRLSAQLNASRALVGVGTSVVLVIGMKWGVVGMLLGEAIVAALFYVQALYYLRSDLRGKFEWGKAKESFVYAAGVLPSHAVAALTPLLVRGLLAAKDSVAAVGVVAIATKFVMPLVILQTAFNYAFMPVYYSLRKAETDETKRQVAATSHLVWLGAVFASLAVATLGPVALRLMTPVEFHEAAGLVPILVASFLANVAYTLFGTEIFYSKKTWYIPAIYAASGTATVVTVLLTVDALGAYAVVWATLAGSLVIALLGGLLGTRIAKLDHAWHSLGLVTLVAGAVWLAFSRFSAGVGELHVTALAVATLALFVGVLLVARDPALLRVLRWAR